MMRWAEASLNLLSVCVCMHVCVVCCVLFVETLTSSHYPLCVCCVFICVVWVLVCLCQMFLWNYFFCLPWFYCTCSSCCDLWWSCVVFVLELSVVLFNSDEFLLWFECSWFLHVFRFWVPIGLCVSRVPGGGDVWCVCGTISYWLLTINLLFKILHLSLIELNLLRVVICGEVR